MNTAIELQGKTTVYAVSDVEMLTYEQMFPNINVAQALCCMKVWLDANPTKRPIRMKRFIANWLIGDTRKFEIQWQATHREAMVGRR